MSRERKTRRAPTNEELLAKKFLYGKKKDPVWVYLEREMRENEHKKPYNQRVGDWLVYLKEFRYFKYLSAKETLRQLEEQVGPPWYIELSKSQRDVLAGLKHIIYQDLLEDLPTRSSKALSDLGLLMRVPSRILMRVMLDSMEDPGLFIWGLYEAIYKQSPSIRRKKYDMDSMLLLSSLVVIDLDECIERLEKLTHYEKPRPKKVAKKKKKSQASGPTSAYLEKLPFVKYKPKKILESKDETPLPLGNKIVIRSVESYEALRMDTTFLQKRRDRNKPFVEDDNICSLKFVESPDSLYSADSKFGAATRQAKKMLKTGAIKRFRNINNVQYLVGGVSYAGGRPVYMLNAVATMPTGYIPINGGISICCDDAVTNILGYWLYPRIEIKKCDSNCDCLARWEDKVMDYLDDTKCKCGHMYDWGNQGTVIEEYFHRPTKYSKFWIDKPRVFHFDTMEDFIKGKVARALDSEIQSEEEQEIEINEPSLPSVDEYKKNELLESLLADISYTPIVIPHLPDATRLCNLKEWLRKRTDGPITAQQTKQKLLRSARLWLELKHASHRALAYTIPFTEKELESLNWTHKNQIQNLASALYDNFVHRNRIKQLQQTRLWWPTMYYDAYPSKKFLDIFFTYLPARMKDTHFYHPYSLNQVRKLRRTTCPLNF